MTFDYPEQDGTQIVGHQHVVTAAALDDAAVPVLDMAAAEGRRKCAEFIAAQGWVAAGPATIYVRVTVPARPA